VSLTHARPCPGHQLPSRVANGGFPRNRPFVRGLRRVRHWSSTDAAAAEVRSVERQQNLIRRGDRYASLNPTSCSTFYLEAIPVTIAKDTTMVDFERMAVPRSFANLIAATAQQKFAAARARQNPDVSAEKPRDAILDALRMVSDAIAAEGYVFAPSGPKFARRNGDFSFVISVQSDRNNVAGQRAAVWVHTAVYSQSLTAWKKKHPNEWVRPKAPFPLPLFTTQLGYLCDPSGWVEWDFADKAKRRSVANDLIASIRTGAYPLFSTFEGAIEGIAAVADHDWPPPEGILSYLLSSGHPGLADEALHHYLEKRPDFRRQFEQLHKQFAEQGLPSHRAAIPHDLAAFAVATGYPWSTTDAIEE